MARGKKDLRRLIEKPKPKPKIRRKKASVDKAIVEESVATPQIGSIMAELDCGLFNDELTAALKNNSKLNLKINNNVVTRII